MTTNSNVKIVDGKLILSLPEAQTPVVWQMDLEKAQSASFTVIENKKDKNFALVFKAADGSTDDIAPFDEKQTAVDILMATSSALQNAHGKIKPAANNNAPAANGKNSDKLGAILAIALVFVLIAIWSFSAAGPGRIGQGGVNPASSTASIGTSSDPRQSSGVAVSADEFLSNR